MKPRISLAGLLLKEGHSRIWFVLPTALAICLGLTGWWLVSRLRDPARATTPFRVGYYDQPPFNYVAPDGSLKGPAAEVIAEACRRRRIPIEWIHVPAGAEAGFQSGKVDLWAVVADIPERRKNFYISEPWTTSSFWMATRESSGILSPEDTAGRSVWHTSLSLHTRLAHENFPHANLVMANSNESSVLEAVCEGKADAGIISGGNGHAANLRSWTQTMSRLSSTTSPRRSVEIGTSLAELSS